MTRRFDMIRSVLWDDLYDYMDAGYADDDEISEDDRRDAREHVDELASMILGVVGNEYEYNMQKSNASDQWLDGNLWGTKKLTKKMMKDYRQHNGAFPIRMVRRIRSDVEVVDE